MLHIWFVYITYERGDTLSLSNQGLVGLERGSIFSYQNKIKNTLVLLYESLYPFFLLCYFKIIHSFSLRNSQHFATPPLVSPPTHRRLKFHGWLVITQILVVLLIGWSKFSRQFAGKPVVALRNVSCFLIWYVFINHFCRFVILFYSFLGPICVVSIAGPYRKGKSYVLSEAFDQPEVFPLGHHMDPETMGIWMHIIPKTFLVSSSTSSIQC